MRFVTWFQVCLFFSLLGGPASLWATPIVPTVVPVQTAQAPAARPAARQTDQLTEEQRKQLSQRLAQELDDLIPGIYADGSKEKQKLEQATAFFIKLNEEKLRSTLSELAAADPNVPPQELLLAGLAYATNNLARGKAILEQSSVRHRNHPGFPLAFARLAILQNRYFDAIALAEKAQTVNRSANISVEAKSFYESEILDVLTTTELRRNELKQAEQNALKWEQLDPKEDKMLVATAEIKFLQNKLDKSVAYLNRRSDTLANEFPTEGIVAKWYLAKSDVDNYSKWIQQAFDKHGNNGFVQVEYAAWLLRKEEFSKAMSVLKSFESKSGETAQSKIIKGRIAFSQQQYASAEPIFADLFQRQPNNLEHMYLYALALLENPDTQKQRQGAQLAQRNFQLNPGNQLTSSILGWALYKTGSKEVGRDLLMRTAEAGNMLPDTAYLVAQMMAEEGRASQAKIILSPFINTPAIFIYRARAKELLATLGSDSGTDAELPGPGKL